jgi:hypothetical protein
MRKAAKLRDTLVRKGQDETSRASHESLLSLAATLADAFRYLANAAVTIFSLPDKSPLRSRLSSLQVISRLQIWRSQRWHVKLFQFSFFECAQTDKWKLKRPTLLALRSDSIEVHTSLVVFQGAFAAACGYVTRPFGRRR